MSEYTENLNLFKIIPKDDAKKSFNFYEILNNNWDKIDTLSLDLNRRLSEMREYLYQVLNETKIYVETSLEDMQETINNISFEPDYSKAITCFNGWISPSEGWLRCNVRIDSYSSHVYIGGVTVQSGYPVWLGDWSGWALESIVPIGFGQTVTLDGNANAVFFPIRKD